YSNLYFEEEEKLEVTENSGPDESDLLNWWFHLTNRQNVIFNSALLGLVIFTNFCVSHPYFMGKFRSGMNVRVAVTRLVYEKALRVTNQAVQRITVGKIVNLISNDASRFEWGSIFFGYIYLSPLETVVGIFLLYQYIGRS